MRYLAPFILCSFSMLFAQDLPKEPTFSIPENAFYDFLDDPKVADPRKLDGKPREVQKTFVRFNDLERIAYSEVTMSAFTKEGVLSSLTKQISVGEGNYEPEKKPMPEIKKDKVDGYNRIELNYKDGYEIFQFFYKNDTLVRTITDGEEYLEKDFYYHSDGQLLAIRSFRRDMLFNENETDDTRYLGDRQSVEVLKFTYDSLNRMETKERHVLWHEAVNIYKTFYTYNNNGLLKEHCRHYNRFMADNIDLATPVDAHFFAEYDIVEGEETTRIGIYNYDKKGNFLSYLLKDTNGNFEEFKVTRSEKKMVVDGSFKVQQEFDPIDKKVQYVFAYDNFKNPIEVLSYYWEGNRKKLDKKTTIDIAYKLKKKKKVVKKKETKRERRKRLRRERKAKKNALKS